MEQNKKTLTQEELESVSGGVGEPTPELPPADGNAVVSRAYAEIGKPYAWGAVGPEGYDCSGLVSYCLTGVHCRIGTTSTFMSWPRVSNPQPGDICTSSSHCGIYIGPGQMIHAPTFGAAVSVAPIQGGMIIVRRPST